MSLRLDIYKHDVPPQPDPSAELSPEDKAKKAVIDEWLTLMAQVDPGELERVIELFKTIQKLRSMQDLSRKKAGGDGGLQLPKEKKITEARSKAAKSGKSQ